MISLIPINLFRFLILLLFQVLILSNIHFHPMMDIYIYPIFILLLPFQTPRWLMVLLGLVSGLSIDFFLGSLGMHAAAAVLMAYLRPALINVITPKGTEFEMSPNVYVQGFGWFVIYFGLSYLILLGSYFMIESGSFYNIFWILTKIVFSVVISVMLSLILLYLFTRDTRRRHVGR